MKIKEIKNWMRNHKKAVFLTTGGLMAATVGVLVFRDRYYIVPTKRDMFTISKHSVMDVNVPEELKKLGNVEIVWENPERFNLSIGNVPWDKLGETGETICKNYEVSPDDTVGILVTVMK